MDDTEDQNKLTFNFIEYAMFTVNDAANAFAQFRLYLSGLRMTAKQIKQFSETAHVGVRNVVAEHIIAILVDRLKVCFCCSIKPQREDFSLAAWR